MKKIYSVLILLQVPFIMCAQNNDSLPLRHHEIGINVTALINELIPGGSNQIDLSPYLVTYSLTGKHNSLRIGFGLNSDSHIDNDTLIVLSNSSLGLNFRGGYEYRVNLTRRWSAGFGIDATYGRANSHIRTSSNTDVVTIGDRSWTIGGGPVITVRFDVNDRIRLSTECTLYHSYTEISNYEDFRDFPEFNVEQTSILNAFKITAPINLFLIIRL